MPLAPKTIEAFRKEGAAVLRGVISKEWVDRLRHGVDGAATTAPPASSTPSVCCGAAGATGTAAAGVTASSGEPCGTAIGIGLASPGPSPTATPVTAPPAPPLPGATGATAPSGDCTSPACPFAQKVSPVLEEGSADHWLRETERRRSADAQRLSA